MEGIPTKSCECCKDTVIIVYDLFYYKVCALCSSKHTLFTLNLQDFIHTKGIRWNNI